MTNKKPRLDINIDTIDSKEVTLERLQIKKNNWSILGFTDNQLEMVCYNEMIIEDRFYKKLFKAQCEIKSLQRKLSSTTKRLEKIKAQGRLF